VRGGTVAGVVVEVVGVVHLGGLVDQGRLGWRRGLVPLRRAGAIACRGERGTASRGVARRRGYWSDLGFPAHRRRRPWLRARSGGGRCAVSRVEEDGEGQMLCGERIWIWAVVLGEI
jgi:hypothetical protein